jgi:hypothetical protein
LQIGAGHHHKAIGPEHPLELGQGDRYFVRVEMLDVVAGKQGIDRGVRTLPKEQVSTDVKAVRKSLGDFLAD